MTNALRPHSSSVLVSALSAAFGVALLAVTQVLTQVIALSGIQSGTLDLVLSFIAVVFVGIALYVGAVVIANTFATIASGRVRTIALLRSIGSSASSQRRAIAREGVTVGLAAPLAVVRWRSRPASFLTGPTRSSTPRLLCRSSPPSSQAWRRAVER